jgi:hypothetical protein
MSEEYGDTNGVTRNRKSMKKRQNNGQKTDNTMAKRKMSQGQTMIYKTYIYN